MFEVDRIAAIIKPKPRMVEWITRHTEILQKVSAEQLQTDCTVLLIPVFDSPFQSEEYIKTFYENIFANELTSWKVDEKHWPEQRGWENFQEWFTIEYHSMVFDVAYLEEQKRRLSL